MLLQGKAPWHMTFKMLHSSSKPTRMQHAAQMVCTQPPLPPPAGLPGPSDLLHVLELMAFEHDVHLA